MTEKQRAFVIDQVLYFSGGFVGGFLGARMVYQCGICGSSVMSNGEPADDPLLKLHSSFHRRVEPELFEQGDRIVAEDR